MGLQIIKAGLSSYVVPVAEFDHDWGISGCHENRKINYFGKELDRHDILIANRQRFIEKWLSVKLMKEDRRSLIAS